MGIEVQVPTETERELGRGGRGSSESTVGLKKFLEMKKGGREREGG